ncbi:MAG: family 1 glycosylhydrolase [Intrasporangium sp.]|uniref:glycoside hydrolase family 1 protein n=1 Tax=Intrasporangium sp. TaxID=1925024 RepID=UPI002649383C|nr:family 1 glycosylhydrolase [Intrasporangium sp.]MDN5797654.1 family 1 glycosylhydrolase [Intrasporangium sp.]
MPETVMPASPLLFSTRDLLIGVATAALQIEGGDRNNNWYDWASLPGTIADGSTPLRATDHWQRWREDTALMADLGLQTYRMSVEWSRIEPRPGEVDQAALAHYREELSAIREAGIVPLVTLHHFSHPSWFQGLGAFTSPASPELFLRLTEVVVGTLGDLVTDWVTINEPNVYAVQAHLYSQAPPARHSWPAVRSTLRHMAIAHCRAYHRIHELQPEARVGFAHHARVFAPLHPGNPFHRASSALGRALFQDLLADAMLGGRFSRLLGRQPAEVTPGPHYDYLGLNYYSRSAVRGLADGTFPGVPVNDLGWEIYPDGLVEVARDLYRRYPGPIWVTENGTADAADGFRARFVHDHLRAIAGSGLPFERYYHWCFVDNWEWAQGERPRFGLVALDYAMQQRTVRDSGRFLSQVIAEGGVTRASHDEFVAAQTYPLGP